MKPTDKESADRQAAATYIAIMSGELARLARRFGYDALGYILDMARMEAEQVGHSDRPGALP